MFNDDIYKAIGAVSEKVNNMAKNLDFYFNARANSNHGDIVDLQKSQPYSDSVEVFSGETEVVFEDVPQGQLTVDIADSEGNYIDYTVDRSGSSVTVNFEPLEYMALVELKVFKGGH